MFDSLLVTPLFRDEQVAHQFADAQLIAYMLEIEVALATVQSRLGVIPAQAAEAIAKGAAALQVDVNPLREGMEKSSIPTVALIQQLRQLVGDDYGAYAHWGATSQDIMDTALVMQLRACITYLEGLMQQVIGQLAELADQHRDTLMPGRTHSQQALPITFGFKLAGWIVPLLRHVERLNELKSRLLVVQFGGAVGTLASLGHDGLAVQSGLAEELGLNVPMMAWHTQRDNLVEFAGWLSLVTGSLAKMAQDIILMAQSEVSELRESDDPSRGGSSTMPQKSNPIISEIIVAAARTNASLLGNMHQAMIQEHERATGAWQMEWLTLPQMLHLTAVSLNQADFLSKNLVVDAEQMQGNVKASNGLMMAEALNLALAPVMGRGKAKDVIKAATADAIAQNRHLVDIVQNRVEANINWDSLKDERSYLGASKTLVDRVIQAAGIRNKS